MDGRVQGALLLAVGGVAVRLGLTGAALAYVKPAQQPLLVAAGAVLVALGAVAVRDAVRPAREGGDDPHDDHAPGVAWTLVLVVLAVLLVAPPPLGAFAAGRQLGGASPVRSTQTRYPPLPAPVGGAVELPLLEFVIRALYDEERSLEGRRVRLTGFVTPSPARDGYLLTRFVVSCCAADGTPVTVQVHGDRPRPGDTWLTVEGVWRPDPTAEPTDAPILDAYAVEEIPQPDRPYEY